MLFIHNDVVEEILTMEDCIAAQEQAFRDLAEGRATHRPRSDIYAPCEREDGYYRWGGFRCCLSWSPHETDHRKPLQRIAPQKILTVGGGPWLRKALRQPVVDRHQFRQHSAAILPYGLLVARRCADQLRHVLNKASQSGDPAHDSPPHSFRKRVRIAPPVGDLVCLLVDVPIMSGHEQKR